MGRYYFWLRLKAALCLCGCFFQAIMNHRDTENAEVAQRRTVMPTFRAKSV